MTKVLDRPMTSRRALDVTMAMVSALSAAWHLGTQIPYLYYNTNCRSRAAAWVETSGSGWLMTLLATHQLGRVGFTERLLSWRADGTRWVSIAGGDVFIFLYVQRAVLLDVFGVLQPM